jgi:hypothetical protein
MTIPSHLTSKLPILDPLQPIARCGVCDRKLYTDSRCRGPQTGRLPTYPLIPDECPLRDPDWRWKVKKRAYDFGSSDD